MQNCQRAKTLNRKRRLEMALIHRLKSLDQKHKAGNGRRRVASPAGNVASNVGKKDLFVRIAPSQNANVKATTRELYSKTHSTPTGHRYQHHLILPFQEASQVMAGMERPQPLGKRRRQLPRNRLAHSGLTQILSIQTLCPPSHFLLVLNAESITSLTMRRLDHQSSLCHLLPLLKVELQDLTWTPRTNHKSLALERNLCQQNKYLIMTSTL